jgi:nicotinamide-nucleotide adenylyltransferase
LGRSTGNFSPIDLLLITHCLELGAKATLPIRTLFILDSSYNPPSLAHAALALTALKQANAIESGRLLLLLSTSNADKAPKPASFSQRLSMMSLFAQDLLSRLDESQKSCSIDIGLTTEAYYTDKSAAIALSHKYDGSPKHVHLMGYDTLIRFLSPKYYDKFNPPLSALNPYFDAGHAIQVFLRPGPGDGPYLMAQKSYIKHLRNGALAEEGFKEKWVDLISVIECSDAVGISSTNAREASERRDWLGLSNMVTDSVASWIQQNNLYQSSHSK